MIERVTWTKDGWRKTDDVFNEYRDYVYDTIMAKEMTDEQRFELFVRSIIYISVNAIAYAYNDVFKEDSNERP